MNGANGTFSGKVGDVVGSSWLGKRYIKRAPKVSDKPKSEKQLAQQAKFGMAVRLLTPIKELLFTFRKTHNAATGFNMALKFTLANAITGTYPALEIDYAEVAYTRGTWGRAECAEVFADSGQLVVGWHNNVYRPNCYGDDLMHVLVYEPETNTYLKGPDGIHRSEGMAIISVPEVWDNKTLHVYIYCVSLAGQYSESVYVGAVLISNSKYLS